MGDRSDTHERESLSAEELSTLLAAAAVGTWSWTLDGDRLRLSPEAARLFGMRPSQGDSSRRELEQRVHADDRAAFASGLEQALRSRAQDYRGEYRVQLHDASMAWVEARGRVIVGPSGAPSGMTGVVFDISLRQRAAERLQQSEAQLRLFSELASDYVYAVEVTEDGMKLSIALGSFERTTGYTTDEVVALGGWNRVVHPDDRADVAASIERAQKGENFVTEYRIVTKAGETRWLRDLVRPILDAETRVVKGAVGGVQDITERRALEGRLVDARKLEALARMAGSVAHDFNNLLTVMFSVASVVEPMLQDPKGLQALRDLKQASERAAELTRSLLTFARKQPSVLRVAELDRLITAAAPMLQRVLGAHVRLSLTPQAADARVAVDSDQLEAALLNLATNARDAMQGVGELRIHSYLVDWRAQDPGRPPELTPGRYAAIDIGDAGAGIPRELLGQLFEPFFTTKHVGTRAGLGLATVYGTLRQLGGAISVASELGKGSTFTLYLPLSNAPAPRSPERRPLAADGGSENIVVVEDEALVRMMVTRVLEELGYHVLSYRSGEELLASRNRDFALLVTDLRLSGMPGTQLAERLLSTQPALRVLLMSGYVEDPDHQRLIVALKIGLLPKPFLPYELANRVRELLDN